MFYKFEIMLPDGDIYKHDSPLTMKKLIESIKNTMATQWKITPDEYVLNNMTVRYIMKGCKVNPILLNRIKITKFKNN